MRAVLFLPLMLLGMPASAAAAPVTFYGAIAQAMSESPEVAAKEVQVDAARQAATPAGALPDPKVFVGLDNFPIAGTNAGTFKDEMTMLTLGVMQDIPSRAKRDARVARAHAEIGVAGGQVEMHRRELAVMAALAWLDRYYAERRLAALDTLERENRLLAETVAPRIAGGTLRPADALAPGLETAALANRRAALAAESAKATAELRRWVGEAAAEPLAGDPPAFAVDAADLRAGLDAHPALRLYDPMLARTEAATREAAAAKIPDWSVEGAFHQRDPKYGWMISARVTVDLPLFPSQRQNPLIASKALEANALRLERDGTRRRLAAELDGALATYNSGKEVLERTRDTALPLLRQKVELQIASYRAGTAGLDAVLAARRELAEAELNQIALEAETTKSAARLALYFARNVR
jgi:outer membrane protein, heavy metal efflux system